VPPASPVFRKRFWPRKQLNPNVVLFEEEIHHAPFKNVEILPRVSGRFYAAITKKKDNLICSDLHIGRTTKLYMLVKMCDTQRMQRHVHYNHL
jgi:hypothetical protein